MFVNINVEPLREKKMKMCRVAKDKWEHIPTEEWIEDRQSGNERIPIESSRNHFFPCSKEADNTRAINLNSFSFISSNRLVSILRRCAALPLTSTMMNLIISEN